ncbi:MAG: DUF1015 family protein [Atopobiaceae bacterium]|jgi:uncharacterized protein (DUF1015 family)|nr:DUF1015 family protein [Atopobiaceae bacterium]MCI2172774.1 DUF1015 family protein [Atopobiaceae bacterium]MCI2207081.1 DUF1015 family protein [Atopobiaceae bacterium]
MRVEPFACLRPTPERAAEVAAPPYDVFDREEAAAYVAAHPRSFLAIDRPETLFPADQDMYAPEVYANARKTLDSWVGDGTYLRDPSHSYYLYRLEATSPDGTTHSQMGVVACCSVDDYVDGTIKRHESTRADKEADRIRHIDALDAQTGPIFLAYRDSMALDMIIGAASTGEPLYDMTDEEGVRSTVWRVSRPDAVEAIRGCFEHVPCAYIADGHHRAASAVHESLARREAAGVAEDDPHVAAYDTFLSVLFPASQLMCLPYNRVVSDRNGLTAEGLLSALGAAGLTATPSDHAVEPSEKGTFGMFADGRWWTLSCDDALRSAAAAAGPVGSLDASVLQDHVLGPILDIEDPRTDPRISFVGGIRGTSELERRAGADGVAFSLAATTVDELMAVADAGLLMPPKSTWFEPKLRSGLFIHRI